MYAHVLAEVDECRRSSELSVTYKPSFVVSAGPSSPAAVAAAGVLALNADDCAASLASSTQTSPSTSSLSPQRTCRPHTSSQDGHQAAPTPPPPLYRPHSVTGLLCRYSAIMAWLHMRLKFSIYQGRRSKPPKVRNKSLKKFTCACTQLSLPTPTAIAALGFHRRLSVCLSARYLKNR